jgi:hypothetical protein
MGLTVGTVRNITTSVSWLKMGCWTREFVNLTKPLLLFSKKTAASAERCVPFTVSLDQLGLVVSQDC